MRDRNGLEVRTGDAVDAYGTVGTVESVGETGVVMVRFSGDDRPLAYGSVALKVLCRDNGSVPKRCPRECMSGNVTCSTCGGTGSVDVMPTETRNVPPREVIVGMVAEMKDAIRQAQTDSSIHSIRLEPGKTYDVRSLTGIDHSDAFKRAMEAALSGGAQRPVPIDAFIENTFTPTADRRNCIPVESFGAVGEPDIPARYAVFRETVERVVREEAPRAKVVTDFGFIRELDADGFVARYNCGDGWSDYWTGHLATTHMVESDLRARFRKMREEIGAKAMGKR